MKYAEVKYQIASRSDTITTRSDESDTDETILVKALHQLESEVGGEISPELLTLRIIARSL